MLKHSQPDWNHTMKKMFSSISKRYDLINALMTFGQDRIWRRMVIAAADLPPAGSLLDIGTGTGKIALEALAHDPTLRVAAADLTLGMMKVGREYAKEDQVGWCCADALDLPFHDKTFDAVTSGYLVRNVPDINKSFSEQFRVVKPGGRVVCLDTSPPPDNLMKPFVMLHLKVIIPILGGLVSGKWDAYRYLPKSTRSFKTPEELAQIMDSLGFTDISYHRYMFGTIVILKGTRPQ